MLKIAKIWEQYGKKLQIYKSKWSNSFLYCDKLPQYIISHNGINVNVYFTKNKEKHKLIEITKDIAKYIRRKYPNAEIHRTMKYRSGKRGKYYVPETSAMLKLISQYENESTEVDKCPISK